MNKPRYFTAYHEAGHAVAAVALGYGGEVLEVSIRSKAESRGRMLINEIELIEFGDTVKSFIRHSICMQIVAQAGSQAEAFARFECGFEHDNFGADSDHEMTDRMAEAASIGYHISLIGNMTAKLICDNWDYVVAVAEVLLSEGTITGGELLDICT